VRLTVAVDEEIRAMTEAEAHAVWAVIKRIGRANGDRLDLPGAPPSKQYFALTPSDPKAPVVIYRPMLPEEDGDWLVSSLIARDQYDAYTSSGRAAADNESACELPVTSGFQGAAAPSLDLPLVSRPSGRSAGKF
jgi:hypothetical protein